MSLLMSVKVGAPLFSPERKEIGKKPNVPDKLTKRAAKTRQREGVWFLASGLVKRLRGKTDRLGASEQGNSKGEP